MTHSELGVAQRWEEALSIEKVLEKILDWCRNDVNLKTEAIAIAAEGIQLGLLDYNLFTLDMLYYVGVKLRLGVNRKMKKPNVLKLFCNPITPSKEMSSTTNTTEKRCTSRQCISKKVLVLLLRAEDAIALVFNSALNKECAVAVALALVGKVFTSKKKEEILKELVCRWPSQQSSLDGETSTVANAKAKRELPKECAAKANSKKPPQPSKEAALTKPPKPPSEVKVNKTIKTAISSSSSSSSSSTSSSSSQPFSTSLVQGLVDLESNLSSGSGVDAATLELVNHLQSLAIKQEEDLSTLKGGLESAKTSPKKPTKLKDEMSVSGRQELGLNEFMTTTEYRKRIQKAGIPLAASDCVCHIISARNGGPDHAENYFIAGKEFNSSTSTSIDALNCFIVGSARAERALELARGGGTGKASRTGQYHRIGKGGKFLSDPSHPWYRKTTAEIMKEGQDAFRTLRLETRNKAK